MPRKKVETTEETKVEEPKVELKPKLKDSGRMVYKCRRCGELFFDERVNSVKMELSRSTMTTYRQMYKIHDCLDGNIGLAEIIGAEYDK
jgi:DNA-directed RNA polymerase subunit RPC12/RpoP